MHIRANSYKQAIAIIEGRKDSGLVVTWDAGSGWTAEGSWKFGRVCIISIDPSGFRVVA